MPRIPVPQSDPALPRQVFTAESQGAGLARGLQDVGSGLTQVGEVLQQRQVQREISTLNASFATAQAELTVAWQETLRTADPSDPDTADRFRQQQVQSRLEALGEQANSREARAHYERLSAGLGASFLVSTEAGMANLAEVAAVQSFDQFKNQFSDALSADPLAFETTLPLMKAGIEGYVQSHGLSREAALTLESEAVGDAAMAAAFGRIDADPKSGRAFVEAGGFSEHIDAQQKARLVSYANSQEAAREAARQRAIDERAKVASSTYLSAVVSPDGSVNPAAVPAALGQIARDPRYLGNPAEQRALFNMIESLADDPAGGLEKTNPSLFLEYNRRALLPPTDPDRLTRGEVFKKVGSGLTRANSSYLIDRIDRKDTPVGRNIALLQDSALRQGLLALTGKGDFTQVEDVNSGLAYQNWQIFATDYIEQDAGRTPPEKLYAADGPLLSALPRFQQKTEMQQRLGESGLFPPLDPSSVPAPFESTERRPNESPAEYLKRTQGAN